MILINTLSFASENENGPIKLLTSVASAAWAVGTVAATAGGIVSVGLMAQWSFEEFAGKKSSCPVVRLRTLEKQSAHFVTKDEVDGIVAKAVETMPNVMVVSARTRKSIEELEKLDAESAAIAIPQLFQQTRILSNRTHLLNRRLRVLERQARKKKQHLLLMGSPKKSDAAAIARRKFALEVAQSLS